MSLVTPKEEPPVNGFEDHQYSDERVRHVSVEHHQTEHQQLFDPNQTSMLPYVSALPSSGHVLSSNGQMVPRCSILSIDFKMWVNPPAPDKKRHEPLHTYTSLQQEPQRPTLPLEEVSNWRSTYPGLASMYEEANNDCSLVLLETNFELTAESPPMGCLLGIDLFLHIANSSAYRDWQFVTSFYENGQCVKTCSDSLRYSLNESEGEGVTKVEMPFESSWWVKLFFKIAERRSAKQALGDPVAQQQTEDGARRYLKELSVVQEVFATPVDDTLPISRVAILLWKFRQTRAGEAATTTWRNLIPPPARATTNSPPGPVPQPPMTLDSTMTDPMQQHPANIYTEPFDHRAFDALSHSPTTLSDSRTFADYPNATDALPDAIDSITYPIPISIMGMQQENIDAMDFVGGHINLYCEAYEQQPAQHPFESDEPYVAAPEENLQQQSYDEQHWAAVYEHPMFADPAFHPAGMGDVEGELKREGEPGGDQDGSLGF